MTAVRNLFEGDKQAVRFSRIIAIDLKVEGLPLDNAAAESSQSSVNQADILVEVGLIISPDNHRVIVQAADFPR